MHACIHTCIALQCIALHCIALQYITLHYITYIHTVHCIALHCITLHYITLHYMTLHDMTLHYIIYIHTYLFQIFHFVTFMLCQWYSSGVLKCGAARNMPALSSLEMFVASRCTCSRWSWREVISSQAWLHNFALLVFKRFWTAKTTISKLPV